MKKISNIELVVTGNNASTAASELSRLIHQNFDCEAKMITKQVKSENNVKAVDPVALSSLLLAIPSAIWAATDLISRMKSKETSQTLIHLSKNIEEKHGVSIHIQTPDGKLISVRSSDPSTLIDIASS
jgi:hypothetical protein